MPTGVASRTSLYSNQLEAYLGPNQTSIMDLFALPSNKYVQYLFISFAFLNRFIVLKLLIGRLGEISVFYAVKVHVQKFLR